jgi:regulator of ribosome biosynthesis
LLQFDPTEVSVEQEKNASLSLLAKMDSDHKKMGKEPRAEETELNIRKAVRFTSRGKAGLALGREIRGKGPKRGRGGRSR